MTPSSPHRVRKNFSGMGVIGLLQRANPWAWCYQLARSVE